MAISILIVDDDPIIRADIHNAILNLGEETRILTARNEVQALTLVTTQKIDVFIIDIMLSGNNDRKGELLAIKLRKMYADAPIIIVTSINCFELKERLYDYAETLAYLKKPLDNVILKQKLSSAIRKAEKFGNRILKIKKGTHERVFKINEIIYIEKVKNERQARFFLYDVAKKDVYEQTISCRLIDIIEGLDDKKDLRQVHKSYIINEDYRIDSYGNNLILKYADKEIPVGRTHKLL